MMYARKPSKHKSHVIAHSQQQLIGHWDSSNYTTLPQPCAVVGQEVPHTAPHRAVVVEVRHGALQRGLQRALLVLVQTQDHAPHQCPEPGEEVKGRLGEVASPYEHLCQSQGDSGEQVEVDLRGRGYERT